MKRIMVTGASAGFGQAICHHLVQAGYQVIGVARRYERLEEMKMKLGNQFYPLQMDLSDKTDIDQALKQLPDDWKSLYGLVNNAGLALGLEKAHEANFLDWETMIQTNVTGLTYLTHQLLPNLVANQGYIIMMGSIAGNYPYPGSNVYGATKAFVKQLSLNLRADLAGTGVRVSLLEPGLCGGTEFSHVRFKGDSERVDNLYQGTNSLQAHDIATMVEWLLNQPAHINVNRLEVMPTSQSFGPLPVVRE